MFPKHRLNMNQNVSAGIKKSLKNTQSEKKSVIFNLQPSDPTVTDIFGNAIGQPMCTSP